MTHAIRDMESHLKNTWEWDKWGFTESWGNCTMSDMDGFVPFFAERRANFLVVEMKHWDGIGDKPTINRNSGQMIALRQLSAQQNFTVVIGFGDTSTHTVHHYEYWDRSGQWEGKLPFKEFLDNWFRIASTW